MFFTLYKYWNRFLHWYVDWIIPLDNVYTNEIMYNELYIVELNRQNSWMLDYIDMEKIRIYTVTNSLRNCCDRLFMRYIKNIKADYLIYHLFRYATKRQLHIFLDHCKIHRGFANLKTIAIRRNQTAILKRLLHRNNQVEYFYIHTCIEVGCKKPLEVLLKYPIDYIDRSAYTVDKERSIQRLEITYEFIQHTMHLQRFYLTSLLYNSKYYNDNFPNLDNYAHTYKLVKYILNLYTHYSIALKPLGLPTLIVIEILCEVDQLGREIPYHYIQKLVSKVKRFDEK